MISPVSLKPVEINHKEFYFIGYFLISLHIPWIWITTLAKTTYYLDFTAHSKGTIDYGTHIYLWVNFDMEVD